MTIPPITAVGAAGVQDVITTLGPIQTPVRTPGAFGQLLLDGVNQVNDATLRAGEMVKAFALDDTLPVHQVAFALEHARLSAELMMQVRSRLLEGYQELMRMQL